MQIFTEENVWIVEELNKAGQVRLLHAYGRVGQVELPETLCITEIGDYCFSERTNGMEREGIPSDMTDLTGSFLQRVKLNTSVEHIGNYCFYNCKNLVSLIIPGNLSSIGSDAFMNCIRLKELHMIAMPGDATALKQVLTQISWDLKVSFTDAEGTIKGQCFFPEFEQYYDEIGPAHIFKLNVNGEGFGTRQCFTDRFFEWKKYDAYFPKVSVEEKPRKLCQIAFSRLVYPYLLEEESKASYRNFLKTHGYVWGESLVKARNLDALMLFLGLDLLEDETVNQLISLASRVDWGEGTVTLMKAKRSHKKEKLANRFSFE